MRALFLCCVAVATLTANPALAQDSAQSSARAPLLRRQIEERFAARIQEQLGLTSEQMGRLRTTVLKYGGRRREIEGHQLAVRRALAMQLRPGTAAIKDSVAKLTDDLVAGRVDYAETYKDELAELRTYLDPVQRAQLLAMRERLLRRAQQFRGQQGDAAAGPRGRRRPFMDR